MKQLSQVFVGFHESTLPALVMSASAFAEPLLAAQQMLAEAAMPMAVYCSTLLQAAVPQYFVTHEHLISMLDQHRTTPLLVMLTLSPVLHLVQSPLPQNIHVTQLVELVVAYFFTYIQTPLNVYLPICYSGLTWPGSFPTTSPSFVMALCIASVTRSLCNAIHLRQALRK